MGNKKQFRISIGVAIIIGLATILCDIFTEELHTKLIHIGSMDLSWTLPIVNLLLLSIFVWFLIRIYTFKKINEFPAPKDYSEDIKDIKAEFELYKLNIEQTIKRLDTTNKAFSTTFDSIRSDYNYKFEKIRDDFFESGSII